MDEQAGPGVLGAPQPADGGGAAAASAAAAAALYNIPGILRVLRHEWSRHEMERAQWEVERAELQAQIAFLQGERRGQENLKKDLVRRIKMLEFVLKQERSKYHKLKFGTELNPGEILAPSYDSDENDGEEPSPSDGGHRLSWRQGRQLLRQYLQEVGYADSVLDVRSRRVRALLGLDARRPEDPAVRTPSSQDHRGVETSAILSGRRDASMLAAFRFIEREFSDGEGEGGGAVPEMAQTQRTPSSSSSASDLSDDPDTEEALRGFDFLASADLLEGSTEPGGGEDGWGETEERDVSWDVDQGVLSQLKEQYCRERRSRKGAKRPNRSKLQDMLATLRDAEEPPPARPSVPLLSERLEEEPLPKVLPAPGELVLGELAGLTVGEEAEEAGPRRSGPEPQKTWSPGFSLRSHLDSVRGLAFHPREPVLVTASEDHTLKLWNVGGTAPAKKCGALDLEPVHTFRAHSGAVLCVTMSASGEQIFSGGSDGTIRSWNTPGLNADPYDSYEPLVLRGALCGHSDSVWGLVYSRAHRRLLSCSADGTVRLWSADDASPSLAVFDQGAELGVPTSVDVVGGDSAYMVTAFSGGRVGLFNMETRQLVLTLQASGSPDGGCRIHKVLSHPTLPVSITAREDRHILFYDNNTGRLLHSMVAHLDAVTCLAVDPDGLYLMSGSHDCSVRLWNMETKTCVQEFTAHRKKFDESVHDVAFHPSGCFIASAGADALAKVFI